MTAQFTVSAHALQRALEMGVTGDEIRGAYEHPERIHWSVKHQKWTYTKGRIALGLTDDHACIATVLWSTQEAWLADYERGAPADRQRRDISDMQHLRRNA